MQSEAQGQSFQLQLSEFGGALPEFAELVSRGKVKAADVCLHDMTHQYAQHMQALGEVDLVETGEFLRLATRLMLLKSEGLLSRDQDAEETSDEAHPGLDLERIATIRTAAGSLRTREGMESYGPPPRADLVQRTTNPRPVAVLKKIWEDMEAMKGVSPMRVAVPSFVRLETALSRVLGGLRGRDRLSMHSLLRGVSRNDAAIHFMAILELIRTRRVTATQESLFGDIIVERMPSDVGEHSRAG